MHVCQILKGKDPEIISVTPGETMVEVLRLFRENNIGFVVVKPWARGISGHVIGAGLLPCRGRIRTRSTYDASCRHHEPQCGNLLSTRQAAAGDGNHD